MIKIITLFLAYIFFSNSEFVFSQQKTLSDTSLYSRTLDINQILFRVNNRGSLDQFGPYFGGGGHWNQLITSLNGPIVYDQGLWITGKIENEIHLALSEWRSTYSPGPIVNNYPVNLSDVKDSLKFRVYKITKGDSYSNPDYAEWPSIYGAPIDNSSNPLILGGQTIWTVYNSYYSNKKIGQWWKNNPDTTQPTPLEIHQTIFAWKGNVKDNKNIFSNIIFMQWEIINKGSKKIDSTFIGLWTDIDFFDVTKNVPAVDTVNQLGYCWYKPDTSSNYNIAPPAVGYQLLYGPAVPSPGGTAVIKGEKRIGFKNLKLNSFHGIYDDSPGVLFGEISSVNSAWNVARGLDEKGNPFIDPYTGRETRFPLSGDPAANTGWIYSGPLGGGAGFVMFSGPFTFSPSDTQWVLAALIPAEGNSRFESIKLMKEKASILKSLPYDSIAYGVNAIALNYIDSTNIDTTSEMLPENFVLYQNYPNPFNPSTIIRFSLKEKGFVRLEVYNLLGQKVIELLNSEMDIGTYEVPFDGSKYASGIYFYRLDVKGKYTSIKKMVFLK